MDAGEARLNADATACIAAFQTWCANVLSALFSVRAWDELTIVGRVSSNNRPVRALFQVFRAPNNAWLGWLKVKAFAHFFRGPRSRATVCENPVTIAAAGTAG